MKEGRDEENKNWSGCEIEEFRPPEDHNSRNVLGKGQVSRQEF